MSLWSNKNGFYKMKSYFTSFDMKQLGVKVLINMLLINIVTKNHQRTKHWSGQVMSKITVIFTVNVRSIALNTCYITANLLKEAGQSAHHESMNGHTRNWFDAVSTFKGKKIHVSVLYDQRQLTPLVYVSVIIGACYCA